MGPVTTSPDTHALYPNPCIINPVCIDIIDHSYLEFEINMLDLFNQMQSNWRRGKIGSLIQNDLHLNATSGSTHPPGLDNRHQCQCSVFKGTVHIWNTFSLSPIVQYRFPVISDDHDHFNGLFVA